MRHPEIPNYARSSSAAHQRCLLQVRSRRHRTPQIFRSQFETKVHNKIRKRVENYVENRSSHVRNPVFYEQICDELLSGFTTIARLGQAERNELLDWGDTPEEGGRHVDAAVQTSLATPSGVVRESKEPYSTPTDASNNQTWATTPGFMKDHHLQLVASDRFRSQIAYIIIMKVVIRATNTNKM